MASLEIVVPGAPRGKGRARFNRSSGAAFTPETTARYENLVALAARDAMKTAGLRLFEGPLVLEVEAYMFILPSWPSRKQMQARHGLLLPTCKPDQDNIVKMIDGMNKIVWVDDSQIVKCTVLKMYSDLPRTVFRIHHYWRQGNDD